MVRQAAKTKKGGISGLGIPLGIPLGTFQTTYLWCATRFEFPQTNSGVEFAAAENPLSLSFMYFYRPLYTK